MNMSGSGPVLSDVALDITVECVDDRGIHHSIDAVLDYRRSDPFAVAMTFVTGEGDLVWTFGRDLLAEGITTPAGDGDVHVAPAIGLSWHRHGQHRAQLPRRPPGAPGPVHRRHRLRLPQLRRRRRRARSPSTSTSTRSSARSWLFLIPGVAVRLPYWCECWAIQLACIVE